MIPPFEGSIAWPPQPLCGARPSSSKERAAAAITGKRRRHKNSDDISAYVGRFVGSYQTLQSSASESIYSERAFDQRTDHYGVRTSTCISGDDWAIE